MRYVTVDEVIHINHQLIAVDQPTLVGQQKVRDRGLVETAVGRPMQSAFGADAFPTLREKAAALLIALARYHPFVDGNKRTATIAALWMLAINGQRVMWDPAAALERIVALAEGQGEVAEFAQWLTTEPRDPVPEPDAARDAALIAQLLTDHAWLLAELARR